MKVRGVFGVGGFAKCIVQTLDKHPLNTASKIIGLQLGVTLCLAAIVWGWLGVSDARSVLLGGLICLLPNVFLATRLFVAGKSGDARRVLRAAWLGEIGKLLLTAVMFAFVFVNVQPLNAGLLFAAFIIAQSVVLVGLLMNDRQPSGTLV